MASSAFSGGEALPEHRQVLAEDHAACSRPDKRGAVLRGRRDAQPGNAARAARQGTRQMAQIVWWLSERIVHLRIKALFFA